VASRYESSPIRDGINRVVPYFRNHQIRFAGSIGDNALIDDRQEIAGPKPVCR
jgi:hypothetical protein